MKHFFRLKENNTTVKTEILAGLTTFMTMAYILAVCPGVLSTTGMDKNALFTATALSAIVATLAMALIARLPFSLIPGMGAMAFFSYTVVQGMGYSWQFALTAVFLEGIIFILLTIFNIREHIINAIPVQLRNAMSVGIGLFIAFIGLQHAGIIVKNDQVLVGLGNMASNSVLIAFLGILLTGVLYVYRIKGALLIGILVATIAGIPAGITKLPEHGYIEMPPSIEPIFFQFQWDNIFTIDMIIVLVTFLFVDMFDTIGTLIGVTTKAKMLDAKGKVPRAKQALFADAIGTTLGSMLGTSTVTTCIESASGVAEGGRTGLTSLTVAVLFALALFFAPVFIMIPEAATAPALILVGLFMLSPIKDIKLDDYAESIPAFFTIIMMPLTYSIAEGIAFGMLSYVLLKVATGKAKEISIVMYILAVLFFLKFFIQ